VPRSALRPPIISEAETFDCDDSCARDSPSAAFVIAFGQNWPGPFRGPGLSIPTDLRETAMSNEQVARQIVVKLLAFRTAAPFGRTWEAFAAAEILLALNAASRSPRDHKRPVARRELYEIKG
jgi:hypothetical protein